MPLTIHAINDSAGLERLCEHIAAAPRVALDTEFHAERRHRPELMLLQLATSAEEVWLVDPKAIHPAPLGPSLSDTPLIVHGGQQDVRILREVIGLAPGDVFDTQIGAGMLGIHYPDRLGNLAAKLLSMPLDKSPTLTDWSRRPLSNEQLRYAADDAAILLPLWAALEAQLAPLGRSAWAWEASAEMVAGALSPPPPSAYWTSWEVATRMAPKEWITLGVLREWRAALAEKQGRPPNAVLPNGILIDLARRRPSNKRGLLANRRIHNGFIRHHGVALLQQIAKVEAGEATLPPQPPTRAERDVADALRLWARAVGATEQIAPRLLLPDVLRATLAQERDVASLRGWRAPFRAPLEKFLSGAAGISLTGRNDSASLQVILK